MSKTRNNHYVPQWYQEGFFEPGRGTLALLDLSPDRRALDDGRVIVERSRFKSPTSRAFVQRDLYSTFFGANVNDEIERRLFGDIDTRGAKAVRAFVQVDPTEWQRHFQTFFEYLDIQKIRTPKGLDWLKSCYPRLTQNELMAEMQAIRMFHCTIWTESVREIVSAEESDVKFIVTDHPVTIFNHAMPPEHRGCAHPSEPSITLKGSQTVFPLNRDFCLILTNLEYAQDPSARATEKRTFARAYRSSMVRTDAFIKQRRLSRDEVIKINRILKERARRYVAAGREEWLYPEKEAPGSWVDFRHVLMPPPEQLWRFGGEMFVKYDSGQVRYQDAFGRTEKPRDFLQKKVPANIRPRDACGCGSEMKFRNCCQALSPSLRPAWSERGIRERNIMLLNGIVNVLNLHDGRDWLRVRRELTDEQISKVYSLYEGLWPLETDILSLLPKPDGRARCVYTGNLHPNAFLKHGVGVPLYFGETLVEHPFLHPGTVKHDFNPVENPHAFRQEFLKSAFLFLNVMPLVTSGLLNLVPDPCCFDFYLRDEVHRLAERRVKVLQLTAEDQAALTEHARQDTRRSIMSMTEDVMIAQLRRQNPALTDDDLAIQLLMLERMKEADPLAVLHTGPEVQGERGGQFSAMKLSPNVEMAMYLAQATGASIVTDSPLRWRELATTIVKELMPATSALPGFARACERSTFRFPTDVQQVLRLGDSGAMFGYRSLMADTFKYLQNKERGRPKPNVEASLAARLGRLQPAPELSRSDAIARPVSVMIPIGGLQDNTINRLLLKSSSERHLANVPIAFYIHDK
ncbi:DUF4238 domain-containing protein [Rhizobium sp. BK491]|uniref:DUF4238 domain-containing protein n=1 Tax=Rhizobium sp. BK491 TaxID=2587009 RepID=UPI001618570F|nr:DUF4238 domain-containing protein [Rhizobium sp. BK491]MBB3571989.1 hypothetical protein [Rhizobium sp. BK491]